MSHLLGNYAPVCYINLLRVHTLVFKEFAFLLPFQFAFQFKVIRFNQICNIVKNLFIFTLKQTFFASVRPFTLFIQFLFCCFVNFQIT